MEAVAHAWKIFSLKYQTIRQFCNKAWKISLIRNKQSETLSEHSLRMGIFSSLGCAIVHQDCLPGKQMAL